VIRALPLLLFAAVAFAQPAGDARRQAAEAWQAGYALHIAGRYEAAIERFRASIKAHPTAEGHTFLGWSLAALGRLEEAIEQCKAAVALDPDFGNPYNDIGVYLITTGRYDEAIPWLEKAIAARRYCCYHFAHTNLGRVLLAKGRLDEAGRQFELALEREPGYEPAKQGLRIVNEQRPKRS
jgi:tetratricopeptide (TPR) repeat protein